MKNKAVASVKLPFPVPEDYRHVWLLLNAEGKPVRFIAIDGEPLVRMGGHSKIEPELQSYCAYWLDDAMQTISADCDPTWGCGWLPTNN